MAKKRTRSSAASGGAVTPAASALATGYSNAFVAGSRSNSDLRNWLPFAGSADSDILPVLGLMGSRSRDLQRNNPLASGAYQTHLDNILGTGLWLAPMPDYQLLGKDRAWAREMRKVIKPLWRSWADTFHCDAARGHTLDGLGAQVFGGAFLNGDGLALPLWLPRPGAPAALRIQTVESDRLCNPMFGPDTVSRRGGVDIDQYGGPVKYWIKKTHPGDRNIFGANGYAINDWEGIPAETSWGRKRVIHVPDSRIRSGQTRGVPALASIMSTMKVAGDYTKSELKAAAVNAMIAVITESAIGQEGLIELLSNNQDALNAYVEGLTQRGKSSITMGDSSIIPLMLGEKVSSFNPQRPSTSFEPFITAMMRQMAAGLGISYEQFSKDFSKTNYSSARAALLEGWRFFTGKRAHLGLYFYQPIYELFFEEMVDAGKIDAPDFYDFKYAYCRARWVGPGRGWIDPLKEAEAAGERMRLNLSNLEDECAEQGKDWQEVLEQAAEEREYAAELGLDISGVGMTAAQRGQTDRTDQDPDAADNEENRESGRDDGRDVERETTRPSGSRKRSRAAAENRA